MENRILLIRSVITTDISFKSISKGILLTVWICFTVYGISAAGEFTVTGRVTTGSGGSVPYAKISMMSGSIEYLAISGPDGFYSLRISGIYGDVSGMLESGIPHPNPFSYSVNIPFITNSTGDIHFAVYSLSGQKIKETFYPDVDAGSYRIIWDGTSGNGASLPQGFYIYAITFKGKTWSGRLVKGAGFSSYSSATTLQEVMMPPVSPEPSYPVRIQVITNVTCKNFYPVRFTDIVISRDSVIDFELAEIQLIPFRTQVDHIAMYTEGGYRQLNLKGINLGSSPPGFFPGEIAYAIPGEMYQEWINRIGEIGFNSIRVYTLHPPVFYEKLANYNNRHPDKPILLFQGIWLSEIENPSDPDEYDLTLRIPSFSAEIREVIDCMHGEKNISFRPGKAYGNYITDISRWTAGYIIGREISPDEVEKTNELHPSNVSHSGSQFSIADATATEVFVTQMLDETVTYEDNGYSIRRPVSISSWPTLDPLEHPTEIHTSEDKASFELNKINGKDLMAGLFATYHAYPYYPNFISYQPSYQSFTDDEGPNSYSGYLADLKNNYSGIPLIVGEFGVPSSWGSAHQSFSNMNHGGYSEKQQGDKNIRMMHNIIDAGCAGGFMFSWMDEWFKPTWIVQYLEAFGLPSNGTIIPTRQLWHNVVSPEQNFGLVTFIEEGILPFIPYQKNNPSGSVEKIEVTNDNSLFYLNIEVNQNLVTGDTVMIAFDTYSGSTGESKLPNGKILSNRSEFLLTMVLGEDTALYHVIEAYDMNGLTPRFNLSNPLIQKYQSIVTDGAPWKVMEWINDEYEQMKHEIGLLPVENSSDFTPGQRTALAWSSSGLKIRIPWTLLYFFDPTQMQVINGAVSDDDGYSFEIVPAQSDGIAVSVYYDGTVTSATDRYNWNKWLVVPPTTIREKESLHIVESGLLSIPGFAD